MNCSLFNEPLKTGPIVALEIVEKQPDDDE